MNSDSAGSGVTDNRERQRYELTIADHTAFAAYAIDGDVITFTHPNWADRALPAA